MNLIDHIKVFLSLQASLIFLLREEYKNCKDIKFLLDFPKRGTLSLDNIEWKFIKHGAGFLFVNMEKKIEVDVPRNINMVSVFDVNRLEQYLESIGVNVDSLEEDLEREIILGTILYEDLEYRLLKLA